MSQFLLGADPEFMIFDREGNLRSAIGIVKGTKEKKLDLGGGHQCFYDNVLCEVNVRPGGSESEVIASFSDCLRRLAKAVSPYRLAPQASATYPEKECQHPDARVFGCDPEYCAYEMCQVTPPTCESSFRSGGGHIHLGATKESYPLLAPVKGDDRMDRDWGRVWVIRAMDLFVGLPSLFIDHDPTSAARRKLYGNAGTHRPKEEYGVEYRATSNFWIASPRLMTLVYNLSQFAVRFAAERLHEELWKGESECVGYSVADLRRAINESDKELAGKLINGVVKKYLPARLMNDIFKFSEPTSYNFYREWGLA